MNAQQVAVDPAKLSFFSFIYVYAWIVLYRIAIRIVTGSYPRRWNVAFATIVDGVAFLAVHTFAVPLLGNYLTGTKLQWADLAISAITMLVVFGTVITLANGKRLGILKAFVARILAGVFVVILLSVLFLGTGFIFGKKGTDDFVQTWHAMHAELRTKSGIQYPDYEALMRSKLGFLFNDSPAPLATTSPSPGVSASPSAPTVPTGPAPGAHCVLKNPIQMQVPYGSITVPAGSTVTIVEVQGDSCTVENNGRTFTVSQSDLAMQP